MADQTIDKTFFQGHPNKDLSTLQYLKADYDGAVKAGATPVPGIDQQLQALARILGQPTIGKSQLDEADRTLSSIRTALTPQAWPPDAWKLRPEELPSQTRQMQDTMRQVTELEHEVSGITQSKGAAKWVIDAKNAKEKVALDATALAAASILLGGPVRAGDLKK